MWLAKAYRWRLPKASLFLQRIFAATGWLQLATETLLASLMPFLRPMASAKGGRKDEGYWRGGAVGGVMAYSGGEPMCNAERQPAQYT